MIFTWWFCQTSFPWNYSISLLLKVIFLFWNYHFNCQRGFFPLLFWIILRISSSKNLSPTWDLAKDHIPAAFTLSPIFILFKFFQNNFCQNSGPFVIYKGSILFLWVMTPSKLPQIVLSNPSQHLQKYPVLQFKYFKFHSLQVWTWFANLSEIHIFLLPKIPRKITELLDASRHLLPKIQLQKLFPHP